MTPTYSQVWLDDHAVPFRSYNDPIGGRSCDWTKPLGKCAQLALSRTAAECFLAFAKANARDGAFTAGPLFRRERKSSGDAVIAGTCGKVRSK